MEREESEYKAPDEDSEDWKERHERAVGQLWQSILDDSEGKKMGYMVQNEKDT